MCGFSGYLQPGGFAKDGAQEIIREMTDCLIHRGPDDSGFWLDSSQGIALGHRRLAILDLSQAGHQPMQSVSRRYVLVYNGEIYNHLELRSSLKSADWQGHSDTETLLACFEAWGIEKTLKRARGMFAFALWDKTDRCLYLARDRLGEKPLYYGVHQGVLMFASELKALKAHPAFQNQIDMSALAQMQRYAYVPAPLSIYQGIFKLPPSSYIRLSENQLQASPQSYWSMYSMVEHAETYTGSTDQAIDELEELLQQSVRERMISDVPIGAFLSGGIDSSTVAALMQAHSNRQGSGAVRTFSIGFDIPGYNEAEYAKAVAQHLETKHTELYVSSDDALAVIPRLPQIYDEPFADASQIPTFLVSKMTREHVAVALSGDGGDELFCGYHRYFRAEMLWHKFEKIPRLPKRFGAACINQIPEVVWRGVGAFVEPLLSKHAREKAFSDRMKRTADILSSHNVQAVYQGMLSCWDRPNDLVLGAAKVNDIFSEKFSWPEHMEVKHKLMYLDSQTYLPDDILVKTDRAAMSNGLETRMPFLDPRLIDFAWRIPEPLKVRGGKSKWLLQQVLSRYLPQKMIDRPKMGFSVPIDSWLRGPLRDWAESLLDPSLMREQGMLNAELVHKRWNEHLSGKRHWHDALWTVLMFQAWLEAER